MTRNRKIEKELNPPPKSTKPKGSVNLGRETFIDKIVRKVESQASVEFWIVPRKSPSTIHRAAASPSTAYAEIQSQIGGYEKSLQVTTNLHSDPLQERKLCNLREGEGETNGTAKAGPQLFEQGCPMILDLGNATKPTQITNPLLSQKAPPEIL